jgi:hypothetical protein
MDSRESIFLFEFQSTGRFTLYTDDPIAAVNRTIGTTPATKAFLQRPMSRVRSAVGSFVARHFQKTPCQTLLVTHN